MKDQIIVVPLNSSLLAKKQREDVSNQWFPNVLAAETYLHETVGLIPWLMSGGPESLLTNIPPLFSPSNMPVPLEHQASEALF